MLCGLGTNVLFEIESKRDFWNILGISAVLGLTAGFYFTRGYDAGKGYFAERVNASTAVHAYPDIKWKRNPGVRFQVPLVAIGF